MGASELPRVAHISEVAVAGPFAMIAGYPAWFLALVVENMPGGLQATLERSGVPLERRAAVLRAHAALRDAGTRWQLDRAGSAAGTAEPMPGDQAVPSKDRVLGSKDVGVVLGVSDRAVRKLAAAGFLAGRRELSRWVLDPADVAAEHARRTAKRAAA
jgi:hypothetical protein